MSVTRLICAKMYKNILRVLYNTPFWVDGGARVEVSNVSSCHVLRLISAPKSLNIIRNIQTSVLYKAGFVFLSLHNRGIYNGFVVIGKHETVTKN